MLLQTVGCAVFWKETVWHIDVLRPQVANFHPIPTRWSANSSRIVAKHSIIEARVHIKTRSGTWTRPVFTWTVHRSILKRKKEQNVSKSIRTETSLLECQPPAGGTRMPIFVWISSTNCNLLTIKSSYWCLEIPSLKTIRFLAML